MKIFGYITGVLGLATMIFATQVGDMLRPAWLNIMLGGLVLVSIAAYLVSLPKLVILGILSLTFIFATITIFTMPETPLMLMFLFELVLIACFALCAVQTYKNK